MRLVVDASVAVKWGVPEAESHLALPLLDAGIVVPDLIHAEIANVLWKKVMRGDLTADEAGEVARGLSQLDVEVHDTASLMIEALSLACDFRHPAYDFHYVALARRLDLPLVTADQRFIDDVRAVEEPPPWSGLLTPLRDVHRLVGTVGGTPPHA